MATHDTRSSDLPRQGETSSTLHKVLKVKGLGCMLFSTAIICPSHAKLLQPCADNVVALLVLLRLAANGCGATERIVATSWLSLFLVDAKPWSFSQAPETPWYLHTRSADVEGRKLQRHTHTHTPSLAPSHARSPALSLTHPCNCI